MAILTFPTIIPDTQTFGIRYNTQVSSSPISGTTQTVEMPGARWAGNVSFRDLLPAEAATLKGFLMQLRGSSGTFFYADQTHTDPFNLVTGTLTIAGGSGPRVIRVTLGASSPTFTAGDYVQIGADDSRELKMITASDIVSGDTYDLTVEPMIRRTDYVGLSVVYADPVGVFMLDSDTQASWALRGKASLSDINLSFLEIFS
jgi:hypothetical protein